MAVNLATQDIKVNRKQVRRLTRLMGLAEMAPGPNASKKHPQNKLYQ